MATAKAGSPALEYEGRWCFGSKNVRFWVLARLISECIAEPDATVRNIAVRKFLAQNDFGGWRPEVFQAARDKRVAKVAEPFPGTLYIETHKHVTETDLTDILQFAYLPF